MRKIRSLRGVKYQKLAATGLVMAALAVTSAARGQGAAEGDVVLPQTRRDAAKELAMKITEPFTFAAVGDIIIRRPVGQLRSVQAIRHDDLHRRQCGCDPRGANRLD
jgi:hypothetical protein